MLDQWKKFPRKNKQVVVHHLLIRYRHHWGNPRALLVFVVDNKKRWFINVTILFVGLWRQIGEPPSIYERCSSGKKLIPTIKWFSLNGDCFGRWMCRIHNSETSWKHVPFIFKQYFNSRWQTATLWIFTHSWAALIYTISVYFYAIDGSLFTPIIRTIVQNHLWIIRWRNHCRIQAHAWLDVDIMFQQHYNLIFCIKMVRR